LASQTKDYEHEIRALWSKAKNDIERCDRRRDPQECRDKRVVQFVNDLKNLARKRWEPAVLAVLGIDSLTDEQALRLDQMLQENIGFMDDSLAPAIALAVQEDTMGEKPPLLERLLALDHRVAAMYAGALWSAGALMFALFDGVQARDLLSLFMFVGPNDERTCTGPRGCQQYANRVFTLAQILADEIIPGHLRCLTNCRHLLLPLVRLPKDEDETGRRVQGQLRELEIGV
jgi:hypothetical protein